MANPKWWYSVYCSNSHDKLEARTMSFPNILYSTFLNDDIGDVGAIGTPSEPMNLGAIVTINLSILSRLAKHDWMILAPPSTMRLARPCSANKSNTWLRSNWPSTGFDI